jgi:WD40 repeat protein
MAAQDDGTTRVVLDLIQAPAKEGVAGEAGVARLLLTGEGPDYAFQHLATYVPGEGGPPRIVANWGAEGLLGVWDSKTGGLIRTLPATIAIQGSQELPRTSLVTYESRDGRPRVAAILISNQICIWDGDSFELILSIDPPREARVESLAVYVEPGEGRPRLVSTFLPGGLAVRDGETGVLHWELTDRPFHVQAMTTFASSDGGQQRLAVGGSRGELRVYDPEEGALLLDLKGEDVMSLTTVRSSQPPYITHLVAGTGYHQATLWDGETGARLADLSSKTEPIVAVAAWGGEGADGEGEEGEHAHKTAPRVATAREDGPIYLWDGDTGEALRVMREPQAEFNLYCELLAVPLAGGSARLVSVGSPARIASVTSL